jgi:hypothetical protein
MNSKIIHGVTTGQMLLKKVVVRPILSHEAHAWKKIMSTHHYLSYKAMVGESIMYVATIDGAWVALIGWASAVLHCKARDEWINWRQQIKLSRLKYIANNVRFLILPSVKLFNLASKILSLNLSRLSSDWEFFHGHSIYLAETFVDPERYLGTCYKAANWEYLGKTQGFRKSNKRYIRHDKPKLIYVRQLQPDAIVALTDLNLSNTRSVKVKQFTKTQIESLNATLLKLPDHRCPRGIRHPFRTVIAISICAALSGYKSYTAIAEYAGRLTQSQLKRLRGRYDRKKKCFIPPSETTIRRILQGCDVQAVDALLNSWVLSVSTKEKTPIAIDGKTLKGARNDSGDQVHLLSAVTQNEGMIIAQRPVDTKTNEITQVEPLLETLDIKERVITLDAMHTQTKTATYIVERKEADYLFTVKDNQPTLRSDIAALNLEKFSPSA